MAFPMLLCCIEKYGTEFGLGSVDIVFFFDIAEIAADLIEFPSASI